MCVENGKSVTNLLTQLLTNSVTRVGRYATEQTTERCKYCFTVVNLRSSTVGGRGAGWINDVTVMRVT